MSFEYDPTYTEILEWDGNNPSVISIGIKMTTYNHYSGYSEAAVTQTRFGIYDFKNNTFRVQKSYVGAQNDFGDDWIAASSNWRTYTNYGYDRYIAECALYAYEMAYPEAVENSKKEAAIKAAKARQDALDVISAKEAGKEVARIMLGAQ